MQYKDHGRQKDIRRPHEKCVFIIQVKAKINYYISDKKSVNYIY